MALIREDNQLYDHIKVSTINGKPLSISGDLSFIDKLTIPGHNYIEMQYTDGDLTGIIYKSGGANGTTVATLTLTYDNSGKLLSISQS